MKDPRHGEVVTFYSYKGGVGRSAAVANVATVLAQRGKRVLVIDFDLEAPGLHRYFVTDAGGAGSASLKTSRAGTIEFFGELVKRFEDVLGGRTYEEGLEEPAEGELVLLGAALAELLDSERFVQHVTVNNPNQTNAPVGLSLMRAGNFDGGYPERVRQFSWQGLYEKYPCFVELLSAELGSRYDFTLIDSRTGTTDVGNLCTVLLPEKLVLVFTPNEQSLNGAAEVGLQAVELRKASQDLRALPIFPLMSRVENAENELQRSWIEEARRRFERVFREAYGVDKSLSRYFDAVQIPHKSFYAYGERIAAARERATEAHSLASAFRDFTDVLSCNSAVDAQALMNRSFASVFPQRAEPNPTLETAVASEPRTPLDLEPLPSAPPSAPAVHVPSDLVPLAAPYRRRTLALLSGGLGLGLLITAGGMASRRHEAPSFTLAVPQIPESVAPVVSAVSSETPGPAEPTPPPELSASAATVTRATPIPGSVPSRALPTPKPTPTNAATQTPRDANVSLPPALPASVDQALVTTLAIKASSRILPGVRGTSGSQTYNFNVWLEGPVDATSRIQSIDYFFDHPSFTHPHFVSTAGPDFLQGYNGWGCLNSVTVTIRWASGTKSTIPFNQCGAL